MIEIRIPDGVETDAALVQRLRHRAPTGMVFGNQKCRGIHHLHGARQFPQKFDAIQVRAADPVSVGIQRVVLMDGIGQVHAKPVNMKIVQQHCRAAGEHLAHILLAKTRGVPGRPVVQISAVAISGVIRGLPFIPVPGIVLRRDCRVRIVSPFRTFVVRRGEVVVHHVHDHGDAPLMAGAHEML